MTNFEYRNYTIRRDRGLYVARPSDGDDLQLSSRSVHRLLRAVDQMWDAIDSRQLLGWMSDTMKGGRSIIDLDASKIAEQIPSCHILGDKVRLLIAESQITGQPLDKESAASEVDPPNSVLFVTAALLTAIALALPMQYWIADAEPAIVFTLAVTATAIVFGRTPALILSVLSFLAYDLCFSPPIMTLNIPTASEVIYALINLGISLSIPWFSGKRQRAGDSVRLEPV
jgi:hypothetical protein